MPDIDKYELEINKQNEMSKQDNIKKGEYKNNYFMNTKNKGGSIVKEIKWEKPFDSKENSEMKKIFKLINGKKIIKSHSSRKIYNNINKKREKACITNKNIIKFNNELDTTKNKSKQNHTTKSKIKKN